MADTQLQLGLYVPPEYPCSVPVLAPSCQIQRNEMNSRIYERNIPSHELQAYFDVAPVLSKYSRFPIVDTRREPMIPVHQRGTFCPKATFYPGTDTAPWSGWASQVDIDTALRYPTHPLTKNDNHLAYIPDSSSDMYQFRIRPSKTCAVSNTMFSDPMSGIHGTQQSAPNAPTCYTLYNCNTRYEFKQPIA